MASIHEPAREVPVIEDCDLCVIGGSCTGVFAAVAAARQGLRVALVELHGFFGGVATARMVNVWHSLWCEKAQQRIIAGLSVELMERLKEHNAVVDRGPDAHWQFCFNSAELTIELDRLVGEHPGIRPFLHSRFVTPILRAPGEVEAIIIEDKSGRRAIRARAFIDASGDTELVHRMGLPTHKNETLQPPTMAAIIQGIPELRKRNHDFRLWDVVFDPKYPEHLPLGFLWEAPVPGADANLRLVFGTRVHGADCSDADQLTQAEIAGRQQVRQMVQLLKKHFAGGDQVALVALPSCIGIRETRRAVCQHTLTEQEVLHGVRFPDAIANGSYRVDVHNSHSGGLSFRYLDGRQYDYTPGRKHTDTRWRPPQAVDPTFYQIPYRSLVPQGSRNVLVAGRTIGTDKGAYGAIRVMINCNQTGEAAGLAMVQALRTGKPVAELDTDRLRADLSAAGSLII